MLILFFYILSLVLVGIVGYQLTVILTLKNKLAELEHENWEFSAELDPVEICTYE